VLNREFELKEERAIFVSNCNKSDDANLFYNEDIIPKMAYLIEVLEKTE
jgi:hypothetical protein